MEWIGLQEFPKLLSAKWVNSSRMHFGYAPQNIQNGKCISLYNDLKTYSLVCRYKAHEAGHGNSRGRPHISILGGYRDADDFRTCQDAGTV